MGQSESKKAIKKFRRQLIVVKKSTGDSKLAAMADLCQLSVSWGDASMGYRTTVAKTVRELASEAVSEAIMADCLPVAQRFSFSWEYELLARVGYDVMRDAVARGSDVAPLAYALHCAGLVATGEADGVDLALAALSEVRDVAPYAKELAKLAADSGMLVRVWRYWSMWDFLPAGAPDVVDHAVRAVLDWPWVARPPIDCDCFYCGVIDSYRYHAPSSRGTRIFGSVVTDLVYRVGINPFRAHKLALGMTTQMRRSGLVWGIGGSALGTPAGYPARSAARAPAGGPPPARPSPAAEEVPAGGSLPTMARVPSAPDVPEGEPAPEIEPDAVEAAVPGPAVPRGPVGDCAVCFERRPRALATPCNHLAVCFECAARLAAAGAPCVGCRAPVAAYASVYEL